MTTVLNAPARVPRHSARMRTTLFELLDDLQDRFGPDSDEYIVASVMRLQQAGRLTFLGNKAHARRVAAELAQA